MSGPPVRVCFVCTGNICRSPTAEVVFSRLVSEAGLEASVLVDSAGTGPWHAGNDMDPRARRTLLARGYQPAPHVARQFVAADFDRRDVVLAIDSGHLARLGTLARLSDDPAAAAASISLLRSYDPAAVLAGELDVPDPYYDDDRGFETVLDQIERACAGLLAALGPRLG
ncbi:MAG: low molecular weight phosphotyrosine protein phosphatase [Actinomycetota bacterium]|nr:low molecular weight phosphotyrosine protein phosphatase [Actinomycetota bacterium]MDQ2955605.1 low molecular weight phosphotyrosine protein phosphatase [Actinomycetota bacterium]